MDDARFDRLTRTLSGLNTRRGTLAGLLGGLILPLIRNPRVGARNRRGQAALAEKRRHKKCQAGLTTCKIKKGKRKKKLCVDAQTDPLNCGGCGLTCASGQSCLEGRCTSACTPPCPTCQTCNSATGQCQADPAQVGQVCGTCLTCRADGQCATVAPNRTVCGGSGPNASICCNGVCCDGCCGTDGSCGACLAFVTSLLFARNGSFGGLAAADEICQSAADAEGADLPGSYKAWLSDSTASPRTRFRCATAGCSRKGYVRVDGEVIATNWDDLTDGTLAVPITINEFGDEHNPALSDVWSHTRTDGSAVASDHHCQDWTCSFDCDEEGGQGSSNASNAAWTDSGSIQCPAPRLFYCFQQD